MALLNLCPDLLLTPPPHSTPPSIQHWIVTARFRLSPNPAVGRSALFYHQPEVQRNSNSWHLPPIPPQNNLSRTLLSGRWIISARTDVHVFSISAIFFFPWALYLCVMGVRRWVPMDPMWWMLLMKGVNLKSPAGYSRSIQEAASSPIQCSLRTDRGRPREKWGDGIGFEALRQVIKSNTPTHQGMWFPQVPLADMLNFLL